MEIIRAEKMGFCQGVQEAVDLSEFISKKQKNQHIYMLGMLVHNQRVIDDLKVMGVEILEESSILNDEVLLSQDDLVIVRAHGTTKEIYDKLNKSDATIHDAACIFVKRIRTLMNEKIQKGFEIVFIGDKNHPEVKGIISHGKSIKVYPNLDELKKAKLAKEGRYFVMAQTTLNKNVYNEIKSYIEMEFEDAQMGNTICGATYVRQNAVEELAKLVDVVLVVGGKKSSNTKKLFEISKRFNDNSYLIEDYRELDMNWLEGAEKVGVTAGASTPEISIIEIERIIKGDVL